MPDHSEAVLDAGVGSSPTDRQASPAPDEVETGEGGRRPPRPMLLILVPTLILGLWAAWWVTDATREFASELQGDSAVYLSTAQNLRKHGIPAAGFDLNWDHMTPNEALAFKGRVPSTVFPPGYPGALAVTSFVTGSVKSAARGIDIVLVVVNLLLIAWLTARMTASRSITVATLPAVLLLFDTDVRRLLFTPLFGWLRLHRAVSSEPLFMAFFTLSLITLHIALTAASSERGRRALMIAAAASAGALLVRYVNVAFMIAAAIAFVVFDRRRSIGARVRRALVFNAVVSIPTAIFIGWALLDGGVLPTSKIYQQAGKPIGPLDRLADYILPPGGAHWLRLLAVLVVLAVVVVGALRGPALPDATAEEDESARSLVQLGLMYLGAYILFVMATISFFDLAVPIDPRIFSVVRGLWYAIVFAVAYRLLARYATHIGAVAVVTAFTALLVVANWSNTRTILDEASTRLYTPGTPVAKAIRRLPDNALLYSNAPDAVYNVSERSSVGLPFFVGDPSAKDESEMREVIDDLHERGGYVALYWLRFNPYKLPAELKNSLDLRLITESPAGDPTAQLFQVLPSGSS